MGINLTYCRSWLRQEKNQYLACPPEIARTLEEPLLRLMGYGRGAYALGHPGGNSFSGLGITLSSRRARAGLRPV